MRGCLSSPPFLSIQLRRRRGRGAQVSARWGELCACAAPGGVQVRRARGGRRGRAAAAAPGRTDRYSAEVIKEAALIAVS